MITDENLPNGWTAASEHTEYDKMMDREYESKLYEHESEEARVYINEIQEPNDFEGWGYQVIIQGDSDDSNDEEELGPFDEIDDAREAALDYMADYDQ